MPFLNSVLRSIQAGFSVFPLKPNSKEPNPGTRGLYDATRDPQEPLKWDTDCYGIPCGAGFVVIDVDDPGLFYSWAQDLCTPTYTVDTPGEGRHLYYKTDKEFKNRVRFAPGADIRSLGGYVVGPGSTINGKVYTPCGEADAIAALPLALERVMQEKAPTPSQVVKVDPGASQDVMEGGRNYFLTQAAGRMQRTSILTAAALHELNETRCIPPLPANEVEAIYHSVSRYEPEIGFDLTDAPGHPDVTYDKVQDMVGAYRDYVMDENQVLGTPTGLDGLDELLGGGCRPGEIVSVLAMAKTGKSSFIHKVCHNWLTKGQPVGYASREMRPATEVLPNLLSIHHQKNALKKQNYMDPTEAIKDWGLYFAKGYGYMPMEEIEQWMRELTVLGVRHFLFDHLVHFVDDEDYKVIAKFARGVKRLATELNVVTILVIQPKNLSGGEKLSSTGIRGGAAVGQAVDAVIVLERHRDPSTGDLTDVTEVRLDIARHKLARLGKIFIEYNRETMDYTEVMPEEKVEPASSPSPTPPFPRSYPHGINSAFLRGFADKRLD